MMKKQLITYIALLCSLVSYSQVEETLDGSFKGGSRTACTRIVLTKGFKYEATSSTPIVLKVSPSLCDPYNGVDYNTETSKGENYIRTKTYTNDAGSRYLDQIQYFDGLGRPVQSVQRVFTPSGDDLATLQEYDGVGREEFTWLPGAVKGNNGLRVGGDQLKQASVSTNNSDSRPYAKNEYEASPLNRILQQYGPGEAWQKNPVSTDYQTNKSGHATLNCIKYLVGGTRLDPSLSTSGNYPDGELYVTKTTNEDKNCVNYEFKDKLGQVILTRQVADNQNFDTYYVYDDFGNLCFVVPPLAAGKSDNATLDLYGYRYQYNNRNLCIGKKLPGCHWVYFIYDKAGRLILIQDGEQRETGKWLFSIPDAFGRVVLTAVFSPIKILITKPIHWIK